jgi:predicted RNA-binding Zn ribbon-like protein
MKLRLLAGALALDFVNTVDPLVGSDAQDFLDRPAALADWAALAGLEPPAAPTAEDLARALAVRRDLHAVFGAVAAGGDPPAAALARIRRAYAATLGRAALVPAGDGLAWRPAPADAILWPVLASAVELLTSPVLRRVKECENHETCGWLFLDASRGGTRRWCSMSGCGARAKMRRYRARHAAQGATA